MTSLGDLFKITRRMEKKTPPSSRQLTPHTLQPTTNHHSYRGRATPNDIP
jgi:hypothetical protein